MTVRNSWSGTISGGGGGAGPAGASAYDLAVQQGFSGTLNQWLASLAGATGATGPAGATGATGPQGPSGSGGATQGWGSFIAAPQAGAFAVEGAQDHQGEYDPVSDTTFFAFYGPDYWLYVAAYDHARKRRIPAVRVCAPPSVNAEDAHGVPSLCIDDQGTIHVVFGAHQSQPMYAKSKVARSIGRSAGDWTSGLHPLVYSGTYHSMAWEPLTQGLYIIVRAGSGHTGSYPRHEYASILRSLDHGVTWVDMGATAFAGGAVRINTIPYSADAAHDAYVMGIDPDGSGGLHVVWTIAEGAQHDGTRVDVFYAKFNALTTTWTTANGTDLGRFIGDGVDTPTQKAELDACRVASSAPVSIVRQCMLADRTAPPAILYPKAHSPAWGLNVLTFVSGTWRDVDTGARGHHPYAIGGILRDGSDLVVLGVTGREWETFIPEANSGGESWTYSEIGGDVSAFRSTDGGLTWASEGVLIDGKSVRGQGIGAINVPRFAKRGLWAVANAVGFNGGNYSASLNRSTMRMPLYGISDDLDARFWMQQDAGPSDHIVNPVPFNAAGTAVPANGTWRTFDGTLWIPDNCIGVYLRFAFIGNGTAGTWKLEARPTTSAAPEPAVERTMIQTTAASENIADVYLPIFPNKQFDYRWLPATGDASGAAPVTYSLEMKGARLD